MKEERNRKALLDGIDRFKRRVEQELAEGDFFIGSLTVKVQDGVIVGTKTGVEDSVIIRRQ